MADDLDALREEIAAYGKFRARGGRRGSDMDRKWRLRISELIVRMKENMDEPRYPIELLNQLAEVLAHTWAQAPAQTPEDLRAKRRNVVEAFDAYSQEVGRENVPPIVAKVIAELGEG